MDGNIIMGCCYNGQGATGDASVSKSVPSVNLTFTWNVDELK